MVVLEILVQQSSSATVFFLSDIWLRKHQYVLAANVRWSTRVEERIAASSGRYLCEFDPSQILSTDMNLSNPLEQEVETSGYDRSCLAQLSHSSLVPFTEPQLVIVYNGRSQTVAIRILVTARPDDCSICACFEE